MQRRVAYFVLVAACGGDTNTPRDMREGDLMSDVRDGDGVADVATVDDATADGEATTGPRRCNPGEACNTLLAPDDSCPATCVTVDDRLRCHGVVVDAVCHPSDPRVVDPVVVTLDGLTVHVIAAPGASQVGDVSALVIDVMNPGAEVARRPFGTSGGDAWQVTADNYFDLGPELVVPARGTFTLRASLLATRPNVLDADLGRVLTFYIGTAELTLHASIGYPLDSPVACGGRTFPADLAGRCCDGRFFPGAFCCTSGDCRGGQCADGVCVSASPDLGSGRLLHGTHKLLVIIADAPELASTTPCADRTVELHDRLGLGAVTQFYEDRVRAYIARDAVDFRWTVLAGLNSEEIVAPGPERWVPFYRDHLATWLDARAADGCPSLADFDEVIIAASGMDLQGYGGLYLGRGLIGVASWSSPWLLAHELGHAFGATDLGPLFGNRFLWADALMGTFAGPTASARVAWAQWGLGDVDHSGVIDLAEHAAVPESFEVAAVHAQIVAVGAFGTPELRVAFTPVAREAGSTLLLGHDDFVVTLPEHGWSRTWSQDGRDKHLDFQRDELQWDALVARGAVTVSLAASHRFTRPDGSRATVTLATTLEVPLTGP